MKAAKLISELTKLIKENGDLEIVIEQGEMNDAEKVSTIETVQAEVDEYGNYYIPLSNFQSKVYNTKVFLLK